MKYKLLAVDCDGTLLRDDLTVSKRTIDAVNNYKNAGGRVILATGRMFKAAKEIIENLGISGESIFYQGSAIFDIGTGKPLLIKHLDFNHIVKLLKEAEKRNEIIQLYDDNDNCYIKEENPYSDVYGKVCKIDFIVTGENLSDYIVKRKIKPIKLVIMNEEDKLKSNLEYYNKKYGKNFIINNSSKNIMEIVDINGGKGNAVKWYADKYGIKKEEIIAVGDSGNDIQLMDYCGLKVAVDNAEDKLKEICDVVTKSNNEDGVALIIEKYCLGGDNG